MRGPLVYKTKYRQSMIITRVLSCLTYFCLLGHLLAGCQGRDTGSPSPSVQEATPKLADDAKIEIQQKKAKNKRRKHRIRTTEAPDSSDESSSTGTESSDEDGDPQETTHTQPTKRVNPLPSNPKPKIPKAQPETVNNGNTPVTPRNGMPPPPPPISNLLDEPRSNAAHPKFPISPDELLNGKDRLRKTGMKPAKVKKLPKVPEVDTKEVDPELSVVGVE